MALPHKQTNIHTNKQTIKLIMLLLSLFSLPHLNASERVVDKNQQGENQAVILMYHHFGVDKHPSTNIRLKQFEAHINYLSHAGFQVWPLTKVAKYIQNNQPFPARVAAITIDDAYLSVYTEAYPRLLKKAWPFTVFVATDGVDRGFRSYMTWQQMREMQNNGATFANHSASHDYLIRYKQGETNIQWQTRITNDINRAQIRLKAELGSAPNLFAYPYGEYNSDLANIIDKMGYVAFGQHSGPASIKGDTRALPRFPMAEEFGELADFKQKTNSLAFFIEKQTPFDPSIDQNNNPPKLEIKLTGNQDMKTDLLSCFVSGQGRVEVNWLNRQKTLFSVKANAQLPLGRSRYNCTAPSSRKERFYWYSQLWIASTANGSATKDSSTKN